MVALLGLGIVAGKAQYRDLYNFNGTNGDGPTISLTFSEGKLYGMARGGGYDNEGCIFSIDTNGSNYKVLHLFDNTIDGVMGSVTLSGNKLYGMTFGGGTDSSNAFGTIFSIDTNSNDYTTLLIFNFANGSTPYGSLLYSAGTLYGMTYQGGGSGAGWGVIFSIDTNGSRYKNLYEFLPDSDYINGYNPYGSLTLSGNKLFGMASHGGSYGLGVIFSLDTNGSNYKRLHSFNGTNASPYGSLTLSGSTLYGMTYLGGVHDSGTIFSIDTNGSNYRDLFDFNGVNGENPGGTGGNVVLSGSRLYGMTSRGGAHSLGSLFSIDTNGTGFMDLEDFNGTNFPAGNWPEGSLTLLGNVFFGETSGGGTNTDGVIFSFIPPCNFNVNLRSTLSCNGSANATATAIPSGGTSPYTYNWNNGQTNATASGLSAGTYTVNVTDNGGCTGSATVTITQPPILLDSINSQCATCCNCKGYTRDSAFGGTSPYTYSWSNGRTNDTLHSLVGGTYTCTVTDAHGCIKTDSVVVTHGDHISPSSSNITCYGDNNGIATIEVSGNFNYSWSPGGQTTATITGLSAGSYAVTATNPDTSGCIITYTFEITQPPPLQINVTANNGCNGTGGSAVLSVSGGTPDYSYTWAPAGGNGSSANGLSPGVYTITVTDADSCTNSATFSITTPPVLGANVSVCCGYSADICADTSCDYSLGVSPYGGTPPYNVNVTGGGNPCYSQAFSITVTDANGCVYTTGADIDVGPSIRVQVNNNVTCLGGANGSATVNMVTSGSGSLTYSWSPGGGTSQTENNLSAGTYTVTVYDLFFTCSVQKVFVITQPPALSLTADSLNATTGNCDGSAWAIVNGGVAPYTYSWTGGLTTDTIDNQCEGNYCCMITDANGCIESVCTNIETSTGMDEGKGESEKVKVYPNPNNGIFTLVMNNEKSIMKNIEVFNVLGQQVYSSQRDPFGQLTFHNSPFTIDLSSQPDGVYFYRVLNQDGSLMGEGKMVIEK